VLRELPNAENALSVALPTAMQVTSDGRTLYAAMLGSSKIAIYDTKALEDDTFQPSLANQITLSTGGQRASCSTSTTIGSTCSDASARHHHGRHPPPPRDRRHQDVQPGAASGHSRPALSLRRAPELARDQACASCHVFGDKDDLAWDLGNPDGDYAQTTIRFSSACSLIPSTARSRR